MAQAAVVVRLLVPEPREFWGRDCVSTVILSLSFMLCGSDNRVQIQSSHQCSFAKR